MHFNLLTILIVLSSLALACTKVISQDEGKCYTETIHREHLQSDLRHSHDFSSLNKEYSNLYRYVNIEKLRTDGAFNKSFNTIAIPVVFHIVHDDGPENIRDQQIQDALEYINEVFSELNIVDVETGIGVEITFCLSQRDPNNQETNGINRVKSEFTSIVYRDQVAISRLMEVSTWDNERYLNIRVIKEILSNGEVDPTGYAYYPANIRLTPHDGVVVEYNSIGRESSVTNTFIHEVGHYLGLRHTFEGGCRNDDCLRYGDQVCDTPPDQYRGGVICDQEYNSCFSDEVDQSINNPYRSTSLGGLGDQLDLNDNFMDYNNQICRNRFTDGQGQRMLFFLQNSRSYLLESKACLPPCEDLISASITNTIDTIYLGEDFTFTGIQSNADSIVWLINGELAAEGNTMNFNPSESGSYNIEFRALDISNNCDSVSVFQDVIVLCRSMALFNWELDVKTIKTINQSLEFTSLEWFIIDEQDDLLYSSFDGNIEYTFIDEGYYEICLITLSDNCSDTLCFPLAVFEEGVENCGNERDDDGDGYIDLFDSDCSCDNNLYQAQCHISCEYVPDVEQELKLSIEWMSNVVSQNYLGNIIIGDTDQNGIADILSSTADRSDSLASLLKISGNNGNALFDKSIYTDSTLIPNGPTLSMFRYSDSFYCVLRNPNSRHYQAYDENFNLIWETDQIAYFEEMSIDDVNGDGIPEIFTGHSIINAITGNLILDFPALVSSDNVTANFFIESSSMEISIGSDIIDPQIINPNGITGNSYSERSMPGNFNFGKVAFGDFNGDGHLESVGLDRNSDILWLWDVKNDSSTSILSLNSSCTPLVVDLVEDCRPEIVIFGPKKNQPFSSPNYLAIYEFTETGNLEVFQEFGGFNQFGNSVSPTAFDLNNDGRKEILLRDDRNLFILNPLTGEVRDKFEIHSGTGRESPIVADVDGDGQAEIIVSGYLPSEPDQYRVFCFGSRGEPWAPARSVWNQFGYNPTMINDDLTIPRVPQYSAAFFDIDSCSRETCPQPYNNFMVQATYRDQYGCVQFPAVDLSINLVAVICDVDSLYIEYQLSNLSDSKNIEGIYTISIFEDMNLVTLLNQESRYTDLEMKEQGEIRSIRIPYQDNIGSIYIQAVNQDINLAEVECDLTNNIDSLAYDFSPLQLDLGADMSMCQWSVITIEAPLYFESYLWSDNTTDNSYTADYFGEHYLEAIDFCGRIYRDTIFITQDESIDINLFPDTINLCAGEIFEVDIDTIIGQKNWYPNSIVSCDTCSNIMVIPDTSLYLILLLQSDNCIHTDSVYLNVNATYEETIDTTICNGESVIFHDSLLTETGRYVFSSITCDTSFILDLNVNVSETIKQDTSICFGDSLFFNNIWIKQSGLYFENLIDLYGCDSLRKELIVNEIITPVELNIDTVLCYGDSIQFNGIWISESGSFEEVNSNFIGCDSIVTYLNLNFSPAVFSTSIDTILCFGETLDFYQQIIENSGNYSALIYDEVANCLIEEIGLEVGYTSLPEVMQIDTTLCFGDSLYFSGMWLKNEGFYRDSILGYLACDSILMELNLKINDPTENRSNDNILCFGDSIIYSGQIITENYTDQIVLTNMFGCDSIIEGFSVQFLPEVEYIEVDSLVCSDEISFFVDKIDTISGVEACDSIYLVTTYSSYEELIISGPDSVILASKGDEIILSILSNKEFNFISWNGDNLSCLDCVENTLFVENEQVLELVLIDEDGCDTLINYTILIIEQESDNVYIPNIIHVNDGENGNFYLAGRNNLNYSYAMRVYDRWGSLIFDKSNLRINEKDDGWDGTFENEKVQQGVYVYKLELYDGNIITGSITILR